MCCTHGFVGKPFHLSKWAHYNGLWESTEVEFKFRNKDPWPRLEIGEIQLALVNSRLGSVGSFTAIPILGMIGMLAR